MTGWQVWLLRVQRELSDWRLWLTRALVIAFAAVAGLAIVGFSRLGDWSLALFSEARHAAWWLPLVWTPLCTVAIVALMRRFFPGATG